MRPSSAASAADRAPGGLGRVCGEDRAYAEPPGGRGHLVCRYPAFGDQLGRLVQPSALVAAAPAQVPCPVHLLDDVGQVEVGGEGPGQLGPGRHVQLGQPVGGRLRLRAHQRPYLLDQVEQCRALLADQRLAEQHAHPADVRAQRGVRVAHACSFVCVRGQRCPGPPAMLSPVGAGAPPSDASAIVRIITPTCTARSRGGRPTAVGSVDREPTGQDDGGTGAASADKRDGGTGRVDALSRAMTVRRMAPVQSMAAQPERACVRPGPLGRFTEVIPEGAAINASKGLALM